MLYAPFFSLENAVSKKKDIFGSPPLQANTFLGNLSVHYCLVIMVPMVATLFIAGGLIDCIRFGIFCLNFTGRRLIYSVVLLSKSKTISQLTGNTNTFQSELYLLCKTPSSQCTSMFLAFHAVISHSFLRNFLFKSMITDQHFIFPELTNYTRLCSPREDRMPDGILDKNTLPRQDYFARYWMVMVIFYSFKNIIIDCLICI